METGINITLGELPLRYETLNELYEASDQNFCLNPVFLPLDEDRTRAYVLAARTGMNNGFRFLAKGIYRNRTLIGKAELTVYEDGIGEIDLLIVQNECSKGYGTRALQELITLTEGTVCSGYSAYVREDHEAMKAVLLHNGFHKSRMFRAEVTGISGRQYQVREVIGAEYLRGGNA